jgi:UvrD/REP helicase N-terminal domain/UvrD-like helicase C-terminal domain
MSVLDSMAEVALTDEQAKVADAPADARLLVTAGPGTGKTHVLVARLLSLIEQGVAPGDGILVLSFSRAAVGEIRRRVAAAGGDVRYVRARTFDSFATGLLSQLRPEGAWQASSYDDRIRAATALIESDPEASDELGHFEHVMVDEVQDLVDVRAELVKAVLAHAECGFTLLGDPAQGIYNFQLEDRAARAIGSLALFQWLGDSFDDLERHTLEHNFRAQTKEAQTAFFAGEALNARSPDYEDVRYRLETAMLRLPGFGDLSGAAPFLRSQESGSTAVLVRTNGQALVVSRELFALNVRHCLQREATDRAVALWVALALGDAQTATIGKRQVLEKLAAIKELGELTPDNAWALLKRLDRRPTPDLDLARVRDRIALGDVPDELTRSVENGVVVSTVHRAKGLEFEKVIMVDPREQGEDGLEAAEEARVLYVGLTRPSHELFRLPSPDTRGLRLRRAGPDERWVRMGFRRWMIRSVEMRGGDVDRDEPPGAYLLDGDPVTIQRYLRESVRAGDPVGLRLAKATVAGDPLAFYVVEHDGTAIGITSYRFAEMLFRVLKISSTWKVNWPVRIDGVHIESVDTVAGTPVASRRAGLSQSGLWLRPRVFGLGDIVFERMQRGDD